MRMQLITNHQSPITKLLLMSWKWILKKCKTMKIFGLHKGVCIVISH